MDASNLHPTGWREWRRLRALQLKEKGWYHRLIAEALGVSEATVSRWFARAGSEGPEALLAHPAPGHPPKLSSAQKRLVPDFLWHGAEAYGFRGEVWTCLRVATVIEEEFGVSYHKDHVSRLLQELHWTPKVPITRAIQRDEEAIERWRVEVWPELRQRARRERRTLVFIDEAGFYLLPGKVRTYAPEGLRPALRMAIARPLVGHGWCDTTRQGLYAGTAEAAYRVAQHRIPHPFAARSGEAAAGDLGRVAHSPPGNGKRI